MSDETQTVGPFPVTPEQKENWKELAKFCKRGLAKQIEHEMDSAYDEMKRNCEDNQ